MRFGIDVRLIASHRELDGSVVMWTLSARRAIL
jgi:hypothetical protein